MKAFRECITEQKLKIDTDHVETCGEDTTECPEGVIDLLVHLVSKRPKQYVDLVGEHKKLLEKVKAKSAKTNGVRQKKKEKVQQKIASGEYLPKDVYEITRKERLAAEGKDKKPKSNETKKKREEWSKMKNEKREKKEVNGGKKPWTDKKAGERSGKPEQGDRWNKNKGLVEDHTNKEKQGGRMQDQKRDWNQGVKNYKRDQQQGQSRGQKGEGGETMKKRVHPSWEAKKAQSYQDTHIKFVQNEVFEF